MVTGSSRRVGGILLVMNALFIVHVQSRHVVQERQDSAVKDVQITESGCHATCYRKLGLSSVCEVMGLCQATQSERRVFQYANG